MAENMKENIKKETMRRKFNGLVLGVSGDKTIMVKVDSVKIHPLYRKRYTTSRKYQVHDEANKYKEGDKVEFIECRPISKSKRWRIVA